MLCNTQHQKATQHTRNNSETGEAGSSLPVEGSLASCSSISKKASARLMMPSLTALYSLKLSFTIRDSESCDADRDGFGVEAGGNRLVETKK